MTDTLNTHGPGALYDAFPPAEAQRLARRFEWHDTPKHGSWLNPVEIELSVLAGQCLDRRLPTLEAVRREVAAWAAARNAAAATVAWQFTTDAARLALVREPPRLRSGASTLVPDDDAPPDPPRRLERVRRDRELPPVGEDARDGVGAGYAVALGHPEGAPEAVGPLVPVVPFEVRHGGGGVGLALDVLGRRGRCRSRLARRAARGVGRVGQHHVDAVRGELAQDVEHISDVELDLAVLEGGFERWSRHPGLPSVASSVRVSGTHGISGGCRREYAAA